MSIVRFHSLVHQFNISLDQASRKTLRKTLNKTPKFRPHYWYFMRRIPWWPRESPPKGSAMRKASIMQFLGYRSSFVSSICIYIYTYTYTHIYIYIYIYKHKLKTILPHQWHHTSISRFHYHRQLYCLINRQNRKTWKKTKRLRTTDSLWGATTGDHWNLHPRASKAKCSSCNSSISGLHMLERLTTHNREYKWRHKVTSNGVTKWSKVMYIVMWFIGHTRKTLT